MADDSRPSLSLARLAAIIAAATSATLGVLKLVGGTMTGAIAMGANKITGLAAGTVAGDAIRYEQLAGFYLRHSGGSIPVLSEWTADVATNVTETAAADVANGRGIIIVHTSSTASTRLSTRYKAGTRIVGWFTALVPGVADASQNQGFAVLVLSRPATDNRKVHAALGPSSSATVGMVIRTSRWTDKDNIVAALGTSKPVMMVGRIGLYIELSGGNINAGYTLDGVNFTTTYTDTVANAFGTAGNPTRVEFGTVQVANGQVGHILLEGVDVT